MIGFSHLLVAAAALTAQPATAAGPVDFLVGDWDIYDRSGKKVGSSHVDVEVAGSMLLEMRRVDGEAQPLWWENSERDGGWIQLFLAPNHRVRAFTPISKAGEWPLVIGADVVLRSGEPVRYRVTMPQPDGDRSLRKLEVSRDGGSTWSAVFDYEYRRAKR